MTWHDKHSRARCRWATAGETNNSPRSCDHTFREMGIMVEFSSRKRAGITSTSDHLSFFGKPKYHDDVLRSMSITSPTTPKMKTSVS